MKTGYYLILLFTLLQANAIAQCTADAGPDKILCNYLGVDTIQIGGNPSATSGTPPFTYSWSANYTITIGTLTFHYYASDFLNDTTLANPSIINAFNEIDSMFFVLTVTDSSNNVCSDSVLIRFSNWTVNLGTVTFNILQGDTAYYNWGPNIGGGIPPFQYLWKPNSGLLDSISTNGFITQPDSSNVYYVTITDSAGCVAVGPPFVFVNVMPVGLTYINSGKFSFTVSPNPSGSFTNFNISGNLKEKLLYEFYDAQAHLNYEVETSDTSLRLDNALFSKGLNFYKIIYQNTIIGTGKFIVN